MLPRLYKQTLITPFKQLLRKGFYVFIFLCFCLQFKPGFAQTIILDSLKRVLPSLRDSARVDCLNQLSLLNILLEKRDYAEYYSTPAFEEANRLDYRHGIAESLAMKAGIKRRFYNDFGQTEILANKALKLYEKMPDKRGLTFCSFELGFALFAESKYDEALRRLQKAFDGFKTKRMTDEMLMTYSFIGQVYWESGEYDNSFVTFRQSLQLAQQTGNEKRIIEAFINIGDLYMAIENYPTAIAYYRKSLKKLNQNVDFLMVYAELFSLANQFDSASYYYNLFDSSKADIKELRYYLVSKGQYYLLQKDYDNALKLSLKGLEYDRQLNDRNEMRRALLNIAKAYAARQNSTYVLKYAHEGLGIAVQTRSKPSIRDAYQILYAVYDQLHQTDSAYFYYRQYSSIKDDVAGAQIKGKFTAYGYEQKIELLNEEKKIQQAKLKNESLLKKIFMMGICVLSLLGFIIFRIIILKRRNEKQLLEHEIELQKLESEKTKAKLEQQATEVEMQALRAQMNPHFIFNCLNSINRFIIANEAAKAADYLTKFAKLIRIVLQQSGKSFIPLEDELHCLQLYMDLEALRFEIPFQYEINCNGINTSSVMIPSLLIQPFVENAIWHGLHEKENANGKININMNRQNGILHCKISDNGIGRARATALREDAENGKKSLGIKLTQHRLQLIDPLKSEEVGVEIYDLTDESGENAGTCVEIKIPVKSI